MSDAVDCHRFGISDGCKPHCPVFERGCCEQQEEVAEMFGMCMTCLGIGEVYDPVTEKCSSCGGVGWPPGSGSEPSPPRNDPDIWDLIMRRSVSK